MVLILSSKGLVVVERAWFGIPLAGNYRWPPSLWALRNKARPCQCLDMIFYRWRIVKAKVCRLGGLFHDICCQRALLLLPRTTAAAPSLFLSRETALTLHLQRNRTRGELHDYLLPVTCAAKEWSMSLWTPMHGNMVQFFASVKLVASSTNWRTTLKSSTRLGTFFRPETWETNFWSGIFYPR